MDLNLREKKEDQLIITDHGWKNIYFCVLNDSYKLKTRKKECSDRDDGNIDI